MRKGSVLTMLASVLKENPEGCTIGKDFQLVSKKRGYFVALTDNQVKEDYMEETKKLWSIADMLRLNDYFLGYWKDERTNLEYLDLSIHVTNKRMALAIAKMHGQKAIFDCKNTDCIYLN